MAAPYDLPPWLTGEQDKGFLQGAQLGITAARTGTEIAQTRQQMQESAQLQPARVTAAELGNRLQQQSLEIRGAMFPLDMAKAKLGIDLEGLRVVEVGQTIKLKGMEIDDTVADLEHTPKFMRDPTPENASLFKSPKAQRMATDVLGFQAKTHAGLASASIDLGFFSALNELSKTDWQAGAEVRSALDNGEITPEAQRRLGSAQWKVQQEVDARKLAVDIGHQGALLTNQLTILGEKERAAKEISDARNETSIKIAETRANALMNKVDVNWSGEQRDQFKAELAALTQEARLSGNSDRLHKFLDEHRNRINSRLGVEPTARETPRVVKAKQSIQDIEDKIAGEQLKPKEQQSDKEKAKLTSELMAAETFLAKDQGRALTWNETWPEILKKGFKEGDKVLVPPNPASSIPEENLKPHFIIWGTEKEMFHEFNVHRATKSQNKAIEGRQKEKDAKWMETHKGWMDYGGPGF